MQLLTNVYCFVSIILDLLIAGVSLFKIPELLVNYENLNRSADKLLLFFIIFLFFSRILTILYKVTYFNNFHNTTDNNKEDDDKIIDTPIIASVKKSKQITSGFINTVLSLIFLFFSAYYLYKFRILIPDGFSEPVFTYSWLLALPSVGSVYAIIEFVFYLFTSRQKSN